jgi:hypothetical protein
MDLVGGCSGSNCLFEDISAYWNGATVLFEQSEPPFGYREYTFLVTATGSTSTVGFKGANEPGF